MSEVDLLPCPFCGTTKWVAVYPLNNQADKYGWGVECQCVTVQDDGVTTGSTPWTKETAIRHWNSRTAAQRGEKEG